MKRTGHCGAEFSSFESFEEGERCSHQSCSQKPTKAYLSRENGEYHDYSLCNNPIAEDSSIVSIRRREYKHQPFCEEHFPYPKCHKCKKSLRGHDYVHRDVLYKRSAGIDLRRNEFYHPDCYEEVVTRDKNEIVEKAIRKKKKSEESKKKKLKQAIKEAPIRGLVGGMYGAIIGFVIGIPFVFLKWIGTIPDGTADTIWIVVTIGGVVVGAFRDIYRALS